MDLHSCLKVKYSVRWRHSWLPLETFWTISFNEKRLRQIPEQEESGRVAELQRPQVQHALQSYQMLKGLGQITKHCRKSSALPIQIIFIVSIQ